MVADTYSARLGLIKQGTGNNNNNWGDIFNASLTDLLDRALWGTDSHAVTGGTLDLSAGTLPPAGPSPVAGAIQAFTGTLTSNETVTFPSIAGKWVVFNNTTGAYSLLLTTSGMATPIEIPQGCFVDVYCDGTSLYRKDRNQVGRAFYHAGSTAPYGAMRMNGASLLRTDHPDLYAAIGTTYGAVDGTHFNIPDAETANRFIRSAANTLALGTTQTSQNKTHTHTGSGTTSNISADHSHGYSGNTGTESADHVHAYERAVLSSNQTGGGSFSCMTANSGVNTGGRSAAHTHGYSGNTSGVSVGHTHTYSFTTSNGSADGTEARPESIALTACISY